MGDDDRDFFEWRRDHRVIGTGAVVGAGAVASRYVPAFAIAVGVPARVVTGSTRRRSRRC